MKKFIFLWLALLFYAGATAQVVTIPDANFKQALINQGVDTNSNGNIDKSEALAVTSLSLQSQSIADLTGIKSFTNISTLCVDNKSLATLDDSGLAKLTSLSCTQHF